MAAPIFPARPGTAVTVDLPALTTDDTLYLAGDAAGLSSREPACAVVPAALLHEYGATAALAVGTVLRAADGTAVCMVAGRGMLDAPAASHAVPAVSARVCAACPAGTYTLVCEKTHYSLAWITLSDKGASGLRQDAAGPLIAAVLGEALSIGHCRGFILPDQAAPLRSLATDLALWQGYDVIVTTGGTGIGPRDITPQTLLPLLDAELPGFSRAMTAASLQKTPHAMLSRAFAGILHHSLILALPGSPKAVRENLEAVIPALPHALEKLQGCRKDCGG